MTQRDGIGREVGGGSGWGTHVHPWLTHVNVWQKSLQYCKVVGLQFKLIIKKKKQKPVAVGGNKDEVLIQTETKIPSLGA